MKQRLHSYLTRKAMLLLCLLIGSMGAKAQTLEEILAANHGLVRLYSNRTTTQVAENAANKMRLATADREGRTTLRQIWRIVAQGGGGYKIISMSNGKYLKAPGEDFKPHTIEDAGSTFYITNSTYATGAFVISSSSSFNGKTCLHDDGNDQIVRWLNDCKESSFNIVAAMDADYVALGGMTDQVVDGCIYRIENYMHGRDLVETAEGKLLGEANVKDLTNYWRVADVGDGKFTLQNIISDKYIVQNTGSRDALYTTGTAAGSYIISRLAGAYAADDIFVIKDDLNKDGEYNAMNMNVEVAKVLKWTANNDNASLWRIHPVTVTDEEIAAAKEKYADVLKLSSVNEAYQTFFADASATVLKDEYQSMSDDELRTAMAEMPEFLVETALKVKNNTWSNWEKEFRVADYGAFSNPDYWAGELNTSPYCFINNPTGIVANTGEYVYIFVGDDIKSGSTLKLDVRAGFHITGQAQQITLKKGFNYIRVTQDNSHIFVRYESKNGTLISSWPELNIHVEGGKVHGYIDIKKHDDNDWVSMKKAGLFFDEVVDLLGNYSQLHIFTADAKQNGNKIIPLIETYDWYVHCQLDIMGLTEVPDSMKHVPGAEDAYEQLYPKYINNRMLCCNIPDGGYYATSYTINLAGSGCFNYNSIKDRGSSVWAPAHEYGHQNQGAIHMAATTEISNNFFSNLSIYKGGAATSRGWPLMSMQDILVMGDFSWPKVTFTPEKDMIGVYLYFKLYLYYHAMGHNPLFYQKLFKLLRARPMQKAAGSITGGKDYLHFYKMACDAAGEDLTEFFEYHGFFKPVDNMQMSSYNTWYMTTTLTQINAAKRYVANKNYPKANLAMVFIEDRAVASYQADGVTPRYPYDGGYWIFSVENCPTDFPGAQYSAFEGDAPSRPHNLSYSLTGKRWRLNVDASDVTSAAGVIFYDSNGEIAYVAATSSVTLPDAVASKIDHSKTIIVLTDGTKLPLYKKDEAGVYALQIHHGDGTTTTRYTKGGDNAMLSAARDGQNAVALVEGDNVPDTIASAQNVGVNGVAQHLVLTDSADFYLPANYTAQHITYHRRKLQAGWNTLCLPFAIAQSDLGEGAKIEVLDLTKTTSEVLYFKGVESVEAGQPCLIYMPEGNENWLCEKENADGIPFVGSVQPTEASFYMNGSFRKEIIGAGHYQMNADGTAFDATTEGAENYPFRAYVSTTETDTNASINATHGSLDTTGIESLDDMSTQEGNTCYDLQGRKVTQPQRGVLYILNGQKVVFN